MNKCMTLICPFIAFFFWRGKRAGENCISMLPITWIVHNPFVCYQCGPKNYSSKFHTQVLEFDLSNYFHFLRLMRKMSRETVQKHLTQTPNSLCPFYGNQYTLKIFTALNSKNKFTTLILAPFPPKPTLKLY